MAKKQWIQLAVLVVLAAIYVFAFTDWGRHPAMQISHAAFSKKRVVTRPRLGTRTVNVSVVRFNLDRSYRFTEVRVVRLADWQTNKFTPPLWHLISDSNSVPTRRFNYGVMLRGMKPAVPRARPQLLETNVTYRLFVTAGHVQGWHDFRPPPK